MNGSDDEMLTELLTGCGWSPIAYVILNPDLAEFPKEGLAGHFVSHGLKEGRRYSEAREAQFRLEKVTCSGQDFMLYGWGEQETSDCGVLLVNEETGSAEWEFVDGAAIWFWRDDVAQHLGMPPKTSRHGFAMAGRAAKFDPAKSRIYVVAHGRFIEFSGACEARPTTRQCHLECFRLLESRLVHRELVFLLTRYPAFLARIGEVHATDVARVPAQVIYSHVEGKPTYAICAVVLGNPQLLKTWLMALPDHHDLKQCEVNIFCNGPDGYGAIMHCVRWFAQVLGGNIRLVYAHENIGFNTAVNRLVESATAEFVMVTNIDVSYLRFDLARLANASRDGKAICVARQFNAMGAVQHLSLDIEIQQDVMHGEPFATVESRLIGRNTILAADAPEESDVEFFGAACFFGQRSLLASLGPFSPKYLYAYHEDSDLALRARRKGVRLIVTSALDLVHYESSAVRVDLPRSFFIAANSVRLMSSMLENQASAKDETLAAGTEKESAQQKAVAGKRSKRDARVT